MSSKVNVYFYLILILVLRSCSEQQDGDGENQPSTSDNSHENLEFCHYSCQHAFRNYYFMNPDGEVPDAASLCIVESTKHLVDRVCKISLIQLKQIILKFLEESLTLKNIFKHELIIKCLSPTKVVFTSFDVEPIGAGVGVGGLTIRGCDIEWIDIARYGHVIALNSLIFRDWENNDEVEPYPSANMSKFKNRSLNCNITVDTCTYPRLGHIEVLKFESTFRGRLQRFPKILTEFYWPNMARIAFQEMDFLEIPTDDLKLSMPNLQGLYITRTRLQKPIEFPWASSFMTYSHNFSSSPLWLNVERDAYGKYITIPTNQYMRDLDLSRNNITDFRNFSFHGFLQIIDLSFNSMAWFDDGTFTNVKGLEALDLSFNHLTELHPNSFRNLRNIIKLNLMVNNIKTIPTTIFRDLVALKFLDLSFNEITEINAETFVTQSLEGIRMSHNNLVQISDNALKDQGISLLSVNADNNYLTKLPKWIFLQRNLRMIYFRNNSVTFEGFLKVLDDLTTSEVDDFNLYRSGSPDMHKYIYLTNNSFTHLDTSNIPEKRKQRLLAVIFSYFNIDLRDNDIICDCRSYDISKFLLNNISESIESTNRFYNLFYEKEWNCSKPSNLRGIPVVKVPKEKYECVTNAKDCPLNCTCHSRTLDGAIIVDCSEKSLRKFPQNIPFGSIKVNVTYNLIHKFSVVNDRNGTLQALDLSHNKLTHLETGAIRYFDGLTNVYLHNNKLSSLPRTITTLQNVTLTLRENPFQCDCNNKWLKDWVKSDVKIKDKKYIKCVTGHGKIKHILDVEDEEFICQNSTLKYIYIGGVAIVILSVMSSLIIYGFRRDIKVWLFVCCNLHPFDKPENEDIQDMDYDVFISYSSQDYQWVCHTLLPRLEMYDPPFRACLHDRDFKVGVPIVENISSSVEKSRRMIIVLSSHYLASEWCMHEFQIAHEKVLKERTNYLLIVMLEDIDCDDVTDDMKKFIKTNTYIHVTNRWFWNKLFYALPQTQLGQLKPLPQHLGLIPEEEARV